MNRHVVIDLATVKAMIDQGATMELLRARFSVGSNTIRLFLRAHNLSTKNTKGMRSDKARAQADDHIEMKALRGHGGDAAFARAMAGRSFDRLIFPRADARAPIHAPHRAPGDDASGYGSSMLHTFGSSVGGRAVMR